MTKTDELLRKFAEKHFPIRDMSDTDNPGIYFRIQKEKQDNFLSDLRTLIKQVEEERMPSEEEVDKKAYHACMMPDKNGEPEPNRGMYDAYIWGVNWLRSRLSQKEGGEG
jgi:hypothetical protein